MLYFDLIFKFLLHHNALYILIVFEMLVMTQITATTDTNDKLKFTELASIVEVVLNVKKVAKVGFSFLECGILPFW